MSEVIDSTNMILNDDGTFTVNGKTVGSHRLENGRHIVELNIAYETTSDHWVAPISYFLSHLNKLPEYKPLQPVIALTINTDEEDVKIVDGALRRVDEKTIKANGYKWRFHKTDADTWPSPLHGHDYEKGLKLDAITGRIFDASTKAHCETLKRKHLLEVQSALRGSPDFANKVEMYIPCPSPSELQKKI